MAALLLNFLNVRYFYRCLNFMATTVTNFVLIPAVTTLGTTSR
jgi:hypothetical protein